MRLIEGGQRVARAGDPAEQGSVAGTYDEFEVLVRWDGLDGLSYEYADQLVVLEGGDGGHDEQGGPQQQGARQR
jgi:hypothetical protein